jgi:hypothetical protein
VYVSTLGSQNGLGDQLTRYFMAAAVASQLGAGATAVVDGEWAAAPDHGVSQKEYADAVAGVLGLQALTAEDVRAAHPSGLVEALVSPRVARAAAARACATAVGPNEPKAVLLRLDPEGCPRWRRAWHRAFVQPPIRWCPTDPAVPGLDAVGWRLRAAAAPAVALATRPADLPFFDDAAALHVALHVRNGDICLACDAASAAAGELSYDTLLRAVEEALAGCALRVVFFAQHDLPWARALRPGARVVTTRNASVPMVMRHFLGAHVLITGGSSFATAVAAFAPPFRPLVLEAMTKEATWGCHQRGCPGLAHVLQPGTSLRLDRHMQLLDARPAELRALLQLQQPQAWARACRAPAAGGEPR